MQMHYDPESNIARLEITGGEIVSAKEINGTIIHMNVASIPVYIEILNAGSMISRLAKIKPAGSKVSPAPTSP